MMAGVLIRAFVMDADWKTGTPDPRVFVDPVIVSEGTERIVGPEGCLSIPGVLCDVERAAEVTVEYVDPRRGPERRRDVLTGFSAICAQHEIDHLDGVLCTDRAVSQRVAEA